MSAWPQIAMLASFLGAFAVNCEHAGKPRPPYSPMSILVTIAVEVFVLHAGNFFAPLGWPA